MADLSETPAKLKEFADVREYFHKHDNGQNYYYLSVGRLREALKDLPDDMPVMYQRIEDFYFATHNWKTIPIVWERHNPRVFPDGDIYDGIGWSNYIIGFSAYKTETPEGDEVFVINAHY